MDDPYGNPLQEIVDNNDGTHTIAGYQANQTFNSIADDTFTGGAGGDRFVFSSAFGQDTITDFSSYVAGSNHDTVSFATSDFANFAAVLSAAQNIGNTVVILAQNGDALTLSNTTTAQLSANQGDFSFHT